jgi:hypothetical protein
MRQHICRWAMLTQSGARWIRLSVKTLRAHVLARIGDLRRYKGELWIALLGAGVEEGIVGIGSTVTAALRAFDAQYLAGLRQPIEVIGVR